MPLVVLVLAGGCARKRPLPKAAEAGPSTSSALSSARSAAPPEALFSAPIAMAQAGGLRVVAGLAATDHVIRAVGSRAGRPSWVVDALHNVTWSPDAEIRLFRAGEGVALVSRGLGGKGERTLVLIGPDGELGGEPLAVGAAFCATADGLAWVDPRREGALQVQARTWSRPAAHEATAIAPDRRPALVCGDHAVFVLGDGDDDLTLTTFVPGDAGARPPIVAIRDADFREEERDHYAYSSGDELGLVRVGDAGSIATREVRAEGAPTPWRRVKHTLSEDDDVVAVDGDAKTTLVVFTHETGDACPGVGSTAEAVRVLRIDRASGEESLQDLAPPDCDASRGPFWIAAAPGAAAVAWVNRATRVTPTEAAIRGLETRSLRSDGVKAGRVGVVADALADGGCDDSGCSAAVLVRPPGGDGMQPAPIAIIAYP